MLVWVIYDISENKVRSRVAKLLQELRPVPGPEERLSGRPEPEPVRTPLALECEAVIEESDSVYVFPMCEDCFDKIKLIGTGFDRELVAGMMLTKVF